MSDKCYIGTKEGLGGLEEGIKQEWVYCSVGPEKKAVRRVEEAARRSAWRRVGVGLRSRRRWLAGSGGGGGVGVGEVGEGGWQV